MAHSALKSRWQASGVTRARIVLGMFLLATLFFVAITFSRFKSGFADAPDRGPGDAGLYQAEIDRMRGGEGYYDAAATELRARGYPTRSAFNWRTPLPVWLVAAMPHVGLAKAMLGLLALALALCSFELMAREVGVKTGLFCGLLLSGALLPCLLGNLLVFSELWCGVLIALSVVCFGLKKPSYGVVAGVTALFFRELAAPYCVLCVALAIYERHGRRELALWGIGLAAYAVFYALHLRQVLPRISADDVAHASGWIRFGAAGFLISTVQMNAYLLLLPQWVTAAYLACGLLSCATWNTPAGRLFAFALALYAVAFSIAGHDFNQYWGSVTAPLFCLAASRAPAAIRRLCVEAELWPLAGARLSTSR